MRKNRDYLADPNVLVHASNCGVNRGQIFFDNLGYETFLRFLSEAQKAIPVTVLVYSLVPCRFDLLLQQHVPFAISHFMKKVCQAYAEWLNKRLKRSGHVFTRRYSGVPIPDADVLLHLSHSIHMNPVQAGLVTRAGTWRYSSCRSYMGEGKEALADRSFIWALVGGPEVYVRFLGQFDCAAPASVREFLCPESENTWMENREGALRADQVPVTDGIGATPGPGPPTG
jgi:putative transposase